MKTRSIWLDREPAARRAVELDREHPEWTVAKIAMALKQEGMATKTGAAYGDTAVHLLLALGEFGYTRRLREEGEGRQEAAAPQAHPHPKPAPRIRDMLRRLFPGADGTREITRDELDDAMDALISEGVEIEDVKAARAAVAEHNFQVRLRMTHP